MKVLLVTAAGAEERTPEELDALLAKTRDGGGLLWVDVPAWDDEAAALLVEAVSGAATARFGRTYADFDSGEYGVLFDPRGWLTLVRGNPASALEGLGLSLAAPVWLTRPDV